jgi:ribonuclease-3 family protein
MEKIRPHLTEDEERVYKRGKNAKPHTTAKNASLADYHRATGFEAVMGYLYLSGNIKRIVDLMKVGL